MLLPETLRLHNRDYFEFYYGYFLPWKDQMVPALNQQDVNVVCFQASNNLWLLWRSFWVIRYVREQDIDIIHCHLPWAGLVGRIVGKITGKPVIYTEHNKQERYHWFTRKLNRWTFHWQQHVVAVSQDVEESIQRNIKSFTPISVVLNGVDTERFRPGKFDKREIRISLKIPADAPVVGNVAVFRVQKRLDQWVKEANKIKSKYPNAHFLLVGDGPMESIVKEKIEQYGMRECVHRPGRLEEVRPWLVAMDVFMISSQFEGLPIALLEAMSMELPIVATSAGGIKEVINHRKNGLLIDVNQPDLLADNVISLLENYDQAKRLGGEGRNTVVARFSLRRMVQELEELYRLVYKKTR